MYHTFWVCNVCVYGRWWIAYVIKGFFSLQLCSVCRDLVISASLYFAWDRYNHTSLFAHMIQQVCKLHSTLYMSAVSWVNIQFNWWRTSLHLSHIDEELLMFSAMSWHVELMWHRMYHVATTTLSECIRWLLLHALRRMRENVEKHGTFILVPGW